MKNYDEILEILFNVMPYVFWKDRAGKYLGGNLNQAKNLGFKSPEEFVGKTIFEILKDKSSASLIDEVDNKVMNENITLIEEEKIVAPNGEKTYSSQKSPIYDDNGNVIGMIGFAMDVTEIKRQEELARNERDSLAILAAQKEAANHAKTEFISNMSHDIRTPLGGIVGMAQLLEENALTPEQKQYARWVYQSGEQLLNMLNGILDVVSADNANEHDIHKETFELRDCINDIVQLELPTTTLKKLDLNIKIDEKAPVFIISDRTKIHRILLNLLGNAIKFTEKGQVNIEVDCLEKSKNIALIRFGVKDTGIGIPPDVQEKVFDRFFRASPSYKGVYTGHGVGLHIAQSYAKLLGSTIKLESKVGVGTTFYFDMSCKIGKPVASKSTHSASSSINDLHHPVKEPLLNQTQNSTDNAPYILLVEDNEIARHMVESIAAKAGCRFMSASDGEQALELARSNEFDLILTDVGLPGISGHELTRLVRKDEVALHKNPVPIVGLTAHGRANERGFKSGMNGVFTKPINLTTLRKILNQFLSGDVATSLDTKIESRDADTDAGIGDGNKLLSMAAMDSTSGSPRLGLDLPDNEKELFQLDQFSVLDINSAIERIGSEKLLREMLQLMLDKAIPEDIQTIKKAYKANDWELVEKTAHRMKGGAIYCGTIKLQYACQYLERYRKAGHSLELNALYKQLMQVAEETIECIKHWLGE